MQQLRICSKCLSYKFTIFMSLLLLIRGTYIVLQHSLRQKYSRLKCLLRVKGLEICFYLGWSGSILQFRQNIIKVGSKSWLLTCSSNIALCLPSYTGSALKRELKFCNGYLSLLYFWPTLLCIDRTIRGWLNEKTL